MKFNGISEPWQPIAVTWTNFNRTVNRLVYCFDYWVNADGLSLLTLGCSAAEQLAVSWKVFVLINTMLRVILIVQVSGWRFLRVLLLFCLTCCCS